MLAGADVPSPPLPALLPHLQMPLLSARALGRLFAFAYFIVLAAAASPTAVTAQTDACPVDDPTCIRAEPRVTITPSGGSYSGSGATYGLSVQITWCAGQFALDPASRRITVGGVDATSSFTYTATTATGCSAAATSQGTVTLSSAGATLQATIADEMGTEAAASAVYTYAQTGPTPAYGVAVTPDADTVHSVAGARRTQTFRVRNTGNQPATYTLSAACVGTGVSACAASLSSVAVAPGTEVPVGVAYTAGAAGSTGTVSLTATQTGQAGIADGGSVTVRPVSAPLAGTPGEAGVPTVLERGDCVRIAAGAGAYECGDLRLAHGIPGTRALNGTTAPVLLYSSQHARPHAVVGVSTRPEAGRGTPAEVRLTLTRGTTTVATASFPGWPESETRRVAVHFDAADRPTGVVDYVLAVEFVYAAATVRHTHPGKLVVVNRSASPLGAGWWVAGVEQLYIQTDGSLLRVGGDGSWRIYAPAGTNRWAGPAYARPDTVLRVGAEYLRRLPGGDTVAYDGVGRHVRSVSRRGVRTDIGWDTSGRLASISLPKGPGFDTGLAYTFDYAAGEVRITAPSVAVSGDRTTKLTVVGGRVTRITDPDTTFVTLGYGDATGRVRTWTGPWPSASWTYVYDAGARLRTANVQNPAGGTLTTTFSAAESQGLVGTTGSRVAAFVQTTVNGPLPDTVPDLTSFWVNRYGAPTQVVDALGNPTQLHRDDARFPGLVTRVVYPNAREVRAAYDAHAHLDSTTDRSHRAPDGRYATTRYTWNETWDAVASVTSPEGVTSHTGYDAATGDRAWQQVGGDAARRATFGHDALGRVTWVRTPSNAAGDTAQRILYGGLLGNVRKVLDLTGDSVVYRQDAVGRDTLVLSPVDAVQWARASTTYDLMGRVLETRSSGPATSHPRVDPVEAERNPGTVPAASLVVKNLYDTAKRLWRVERWSEPDSSGVGVLWSEWSYDALGRRTAERAPYRDPATGATSMVADSTFYDAAGNVTRVKSRRGLQVRMRYDVLGRLTARITDPVVQPRETEVAAAAAAVPDDTWYFPRFLPDANGNLTQRNTGGTAGWTMPGDSASFVYDAMGRTTHADNGDARVTRTYHPSGLLLSETQRIRTYAGQDFDAHAYTVGYGYDLDGRRIRTDLPAGVTADVPWGASVHTDYDPATGELTGVRGQNAAYAAVFTYDAEGRPEQQDYFGGITETQTYDERARRVAQHRWRGLILTHRDTLWSDVRGKLVRIRSLADSTRHAYDGLGQLVWSYSDRFPTTSDPEEIHRLDALGHAYRTKRIYVSSRAELNETDGERFEYEAGTGRLDTRDQLNHWSNTVVGQAKSGYDPAGNRTHHADWREVPYPGEQNGSAQLQERMRTYYGADEKVRVVDRRTCAFGNFLNGTKNWALSFPVGTYATLCAPPQHQDRAAFEEYRYDALGRRVLVRSNQDWSCANESGGGNFCPDAVTRTIWDGDRVLAEIRAPLAEAERDTGLALVGGALQSEYGRVVYMHGAALDHPIALARLDYSQYFPEPHVIVPHTNWKGTYDSGTFGNGDTRRCRWVPMGEVDNEGYEGPDGDAGMEPPAGDSTEICVQVGYPAAYLWQTHRSRPRGASPWMGSLIEGGRDATGQMYMRNRYYDPQSGRFTQEDPIGLAGGLNLYGFGGGDPVNYSDPYGLCPDKAAEGSVCLDFFINPPSAGGFKGDGRDFDPNAPADQSRAQIVAAKDGTITWDNINGSCGPFGCEEAYPYLPSIGNDVWSEKHGNGSFTVHLNAINSAFPLGLAPAINSEVTFRPDGNGGFSTSGNRDAMPHLGIYHRVNGEWKTLQERPARGALFLIPFFPNDKW